MPRRVSLAALALGVLLPVRAQAWTEASVRSVQAQVELDREAGARVTLMVTVRVRGGWLEGMELAGFDPDLAIDEEVPPWAVDENGHRYEPRVRVLRDGRIQLSFPGASPRRGRVVVGLAYRTSLAHRATEPVEGEDRVRVSWTLPGWSSGLDGVQIDVFAPPGSRMGPHDVEHTGASLLQTTEEQRDQTVFRWRRAHLPRTTPWTVRVDVPAESMVEALRGTPVRVPPAPPAPAASVGAETTSLWLGLAGLLVLIGMAKLASVSGLARRSRSRARPLLPLPVAVRGALLLGGSSAGAFLAVHQHPRWGLVAFAAAALLVSFRPGTAPPVSRLGAWRSADQRWIAMSRRTSWRRWIAPAGLLDATTPLGAAHLAAWWAVPFLGAPFDAVPLDVRWWMAALPIPVLLSGTRLAFPRGPSDSLRVLLSVVARLRTLPAGVALRPVMHVDVQGQVQDARVRTVLEKRPEGLLRLDLALGQTLHAGGWDACPVLVVVTRAHSAAERALREAFPAWTALPSPSGRRVLRKATVDGRSWPIVRRILDALADCPPAVEASRGTAVPQETVRDLPAPRAVGF